MSIFDPLAALAQSVDTFLQAIPLPLDHYTPPVSIRDTIARKAKQQELQNTYEQRSSFQTQLNSIVEKLAELERLYKRNHLALHNALHVPMLALPPEIVGIIFEYTLDDIDPEEEGDTLVEQVLCLTHICARWRDIAISWSPLFSQLNVRSLGHPLLLQTWIQWSGEVPLSVFGGVYKNAPVLEALAPRIRALTIHSVSASNFPIHKYPLEELVALSASPDDPIIYAGYAPALQQLKLSSHLESSSRWRTNLLGVQYLTLVEVMLPTNLNEVLLSLPNLEYLRVEDVRTDVDVRDVDDSVVWTLKIKHLSIDDYFASFTTWFFGKWTCPDLETIAYSGAAKVAEQWDAWHRYEQFLSRSPVLASMTIDLRMDYGSQYADSVDWNLHFRSLTNRLRTPGLLPSSPSTLLPALRTMCIISRPYDARAFQKILHDFLEALQQRRNTILTPTDSSTTPAKALDRLRIVDERIISEEKEWFLDAVGLVEVIPQPDTSWLWPDCLVRW